VALPYRPVTSVNGFAVHRPKFIYEDDGDQSDTLSLALGQAFMEGVETYSEGNEIWERYMDESV
jgi:hypothetical protein